jgi:hypothetical protein
LPDHPGMGEVKHCSSGHMYSQEARRCESPGSPGTCLLDRRNLLLSEPTTQFLSITKGTN